MFSPSSPVIIVNINTSERISSHTKLLTIANTNADPSLKSVFH